MEGAAVEAKDWREMQTQLMGVQGDEGAYRSEKQKAEVRAGEDDGGGGWA